MIDSIMAFCIVMGSLAFAAFCLAWVTILPTIGLLYWLGYLK